MGRAIHSLPLWRNGRSLSIKQLPPAPSYPHVEPCTIVSICPRAIPSQPQELYQPHSPLPAFLIVSLSPLSVSLRIRNSATLNQLTPSVAHPHPKYPLLCSGGRDITHDTFLLLRPAVPLAPHSASVCAPHPPHALFQLRLHGWTTREIGSCRNSCALHGGQHLGDGYRLVVSVSRILEVLSQIIKVVMTWEAYLERQFGLSVVRGGRPPMRLC